VYGADSSPTEALTRFATGADLILVEATLPRPERTGQRGHLTPAEAGEHARAAGAKRLLLVHISDELDADWARREAEEAFGGPVQVATEGATFEV
jgi:ribonuclease BN (tRNA processing enzyme)